jgi:hypothetical protein
MRVCARREALSLKWVADQFESGRRGSYQSQGARAPEALTVWCTAVYPQRRKTCEHRYSLSRASSYSLLGSERAHGNGRLHNCQWAGVRSGNHGAGVMSRLGGADSQRHHGRHSGGNSDTHGAILLCILSSGATLQPDYDDVSARCGRFRFVQWKRFDAAVDSRGGSILYVEAMMAKKGQYTTNRLHQMYHDAVKRLEWLVNTGASASKIRTAESRARTLGERLSKRQNPMAKKRSKRRRSSTKHRTKNPKQLLFRTKAAARKYAKQNGAGMRISIKKLKKGR